MSSNKRRFFEPISACSVKQVEAIVNVENKDSIDESGTEVQDPGNTDQSQLDISQPIPNTQSQPRLVSWIWNHGFLTSDGQHWQCAQCTNPPQIYKATATTHPAQHLTNVHNLNKHQRGKAASAKTPSNSVLHMLKQGQPFETERFTSRLIEWILQDRQPFSIVEQESFRDLISSCHPQAERDLPKSGNTIRTWSMYRFKSAQSIVKTILSEARSKIHISCDIWSSPNGHAFLGIISSTFIY
jgi:hypothetical protein